MKNQNVLTMKEASKKGMVPKAFETLMTVKEAAVLMELSYYTLVTQINLGKFTAFGLGNTLVTTQKYVNEYLKNSKGRLGLNKGQKINRPSKKNQEEKEGAVE